MSRNGVLTTRWLEDGFERHVWVDQTNVRSECAATSTRTLSSNLSARCAMTGTSTERFLLAFDHRKDLIQAAARRLIEAKIGELEGVVVVSSAALDSSP